MRSQALLARLARLHPLVNRLWKENAFTTPQPNEEGDSILMHHDTNPQTRLPNVTRLLEAF